MRRSSMTFLFLVMAGCGSKQAATESSAEAVPGTPGHIRVECKAVVDGYENYSTDMTAATPDICAVSPDGILTLKVKGQGADAVLLIIPGYHGADSYPLTGRSYITLTNSTPGGGREQESENCSASTACTAEVTDDAAGTAADAPHPLAFAVSCNQLCDVNTHVCTAGGGGPVTWSFRGDCSVR